MPIRTLPARQRGFTLIELVAAFVIFALGFGVLLQILSTCLHSTAQSADYTRAALLAQSLLDPVGVGEPLGEGSSGGRFDDKYTWQLRVAKIDPPEPIAAVGLATPAGAAGGGQLAVSDLSPSNIDLYQLELVVSWGSYYMSHSARFVTLRAMTPDANANGFPLSAPTAGQRKQ